VTSTCRYSTPNVNGKPPKIAQARITGPEVINGKVHSRAFEFLKDGGCRFGILHKDALGKLEVEIARLQAGFSEDGANVFEESLGAEFAGRHIDGNSLERQARILPFARLFTGRAQHPSADGKNEATIFGDGHELGRGNKPSIRVFCALSHSIEARKG